jgi:hypothetical protein
VPGFTLRWERHTEFCTYTFLRPADDRPPFACAPLEVLPDGWLQALPGELLVAVQVAVLADPAPDPFSERLQALFEDQMPIGSRIVDDRAAVWTTLKLHADGFSRFLVYNTGLNDFQTGRTLQRLLEIETYRTMALLGFPAAKRIWPRVRRLDMELAGVIDRLAHAEGPEAEQQLLKELSVISQAIEHMRSDTNYRFSATRAYMALMNRRLEDLREHKYPGRSSITKFLERRMTPALDTCDSVDAHLQDLSLRVARATEALRARIETPSRTRTAACWIRSTGAACSSCGCRRPSRACRWRRSATTWSAAELRPEGLADAGCRPARRVGHGPADRARGARRVVAGALAAAPDRRARRLMSAGADRLEETPGSGSVGEVPAELRDFLGAPTPDAWTAAAADPANLPMLLVDHANCEKKAASTALALLFRYEAHDELTERSVAPGAGGAAAL